MTYSILGSGAIGSALASQFARKGIPVALANSRGPASLSELAGRLGPFVTAAPVDEALRADVVILAVPFTAVGGAVAGAPAWDGRIVIDATNAIDFPAFTPKDLGGRLSSEIVAEAVPGARLVKAFNTLPAAVLARDPAQDGGRRVVFLSGNDNAANAVVADLAERLGFAPITLGTLSEGGRLQQFGAPLVAQNLTKHA
ncbi:NADPH-dependent F420 reductase [Arenibaculum pallidiluteum]|uniref:NADPH-dependent F420 reductase n=1 Tax=Arenibaculum pallidiluteum TaxID=2812559 RepID=UPI001A963604|nr:NADPH-dependent F420 reductase [Arenibaculum pallidiluteum]